MKNVGLSIILAAVVLSLSAAQNKKAWDGSEIETKQRAAQAAATVAVASKKPFASMKDEILCKLPHELWRIIGGYNPYFYCSRELSIPHLKLPTQYPIEATPSPICTSFTDQNNQLVYMVENGKPGHFTLYNHDGTERARCTSHRDRLTKVFVMPTIHGESDTLEKRSYKFVTSSHDGILKFWDEDGREVADELSFFGQDKIDDFDILTNQVFKGKKRDMVAIALSKTPSVYLYDISRRKYLLIELRTWGNMGASHIKLLPCQHGLKVVTSEKMLDLTTPRNKRIQSALCWYDVETHTRLLRNMDFNGLITRMDAVCDDESTLIFVGDDQGTVKGFKHSHAICKVAQCMKPLLRADKKAIVSLKAYKDVTDYESPHIVIQAADDDGAQDMHSATQRVDATIKPSVTQNKIFFVHRGTDTHDRPCLLTCSDGRVQLWEKDVDPFNGCLVEDQKPTQHIQVEEQSVDEASPISCTCIIQ